FMGVARIAERALHHGGIVLVDMNGELVLLLLDCGDGFAAKQRGPRQRGNADFENRPAIHVAFLPDLILESHDTRNESAIEIGEKFGPRIPCGVPPESETRKIRDSSP